MGLTAASASGRGVGLAVLCLVALCSRNASACECGGAGPPCQNAFQVDAVFLGTVRAVSTLGGTPDSPVPLVHLLLRGPGAARDAQTDEHGRYDIAGVPSGVYELQAIPPAVFSARNLQHRINIPDSRACVAADFRVLYDGRLSGVALRSDGQPAEGVQVELISGDRL